MKMLPISLLKTGIFQYFPETLPRKLTKIWVSGCG